MEVNRKLLILSMVFFLTLPFVIADLAVPILAGINIGVFFFLIPIIFLEGTLFWLIINKYFKLQVGYQFSILILLVANAVSTIVGIFIADFSPIFENPPLNVMSIFLMVAFFLSVLIEMVIIFLFLWKRAENPWGLSVKLSFIVNLASYLLLIIAFAILSTFPAPSSQTSPKPDCLIPEGEWLTGGNCVNISDIVDHKACMGRDERVSYSYACYDNNKNIVEDQVCCQVIDGIDNETRGEPGCSEYKGYCVNLLDAFRGRACVGFNHQLSSAACYDENGNYRNDQRCCLPKS